MLYKRSKKPGAHWWVKFQCKGEYVRQSCGTDSRDLAEQFEQRLRENLWKEDVLGDTLHTWGEACQRWYKEKGGKRSIDRDRRAVKVLKIPPSTNLKELDVADYVDGQCARNLGVLRAILNACKRWGWLTATPIVNMPREEKHEPRWITKEQFETLCKELPRHAAELARFAASTGLRSANVRRLRWSAVDLEFKRTRIAASESKTAKAISVPLNQDAVAVLERQSGAHEIFVFTDDAGHAPIGSVKTCWNKAVKRAGIPDFRFHDLRHTWAAWHTIAGTPPLILKELGGWSSLAMVERYASLNPGHLSEWADNSSVGKTA